MFAADRRDLHYVKPAGKHVAREVKAGGNSRMDQRYVLLERALDTQRIVCNVAL